MPAITITKNWDDGFPLTEDQLDDIKESVETFFNVTKIDDTNVQAGGLSSVSLATNAITTVKITDSNVTTSKIADAAITQAKLAATNTAISSSNSGSFSTSSSSLTDVTNLSVTITTLGRPVQIELVPDSTSLGTTADVVAVTSSAGFAFLRDSTVLGVERLFGATYPAGGFRFTDHGAVAGTYTYKVQVAVVLATTVLVNNCKLRVTEKIAG